MVQLTATDLNSTASGQVHVDELPNVCPICHVTIQPVLLGAPNACTSEWLEVAFRCTNKKCRRQFIALYKYSRLNGSTKVYSIDQVLPATPKAPEFDEAVKVLSPNFQSIYGQSSVAETYDLMELAGTGFRKAFEILIKDYATSLDPAEGEKIKGKQLAEVIRDHLSGNKLTIVSSRAAWLGDGEAQNENRWIGKDLQDLKKLISATVHFIAMERLVAELPTEMQETRTAPASAAEPRE